MARRTARKTPKQGPNIWVVHRGSRFSVKEEGRGDYLIPPVTQRLATTIGRLLARTNHSELVVQGKLGQIRLRDSHGADSPYRRG
jgi:hypothetical protein